MSRVSITARAGVHADPGSLGGREPLQHAVVEGDEGLEQPLRGIELDDEPAFREVDLHVGRTRGQTLTDIGLGFAHQVFEKLLL